MARLSDLGRAIFTTKHMDLTKYMADRKVEVHILDAFEGESKGTTKVLDRITAKQLIAEGVAVDATDGKPHPEAKEEKTNKEADTRKDKTDKAATGIQAK